MQQPNANAPIETMSLVGMILGIAGLLAVGGISLVGCLACVGIAPSIAAVVLGHLGLSKVAESQGALSGRGFAIAGLVTGYLAVAIWGILFLLAFFGIAALGVFAM